MQTQKYQVQYGLAQPQRTTITFLHTVEYDENTVYVFDKRFTDYKAFKHFTENKTAFVTLIEDNSVYEKLEIKEVPRNIHSGVLQDEIIEIEVKQGKTLSKLKVRKVKFYDRENSR